MKKTIVSCICYAGLMASAAAMSFGVSRWVRISFSDKPEPTLPITYKLQQNQFGEYKVVCRCGPEVAYGYSDKKYTIRIAVRDWETHRKQHEIWKDCN
ncbi:MAG: hypothetical protein M0P12_01710 [Paludibacteraceae bacterium]|nr:hypothetical protein [Paludibacteraceae bacterium]